MFLNVQGVQQGWFYTFIFILSKVMEVRSHDSIKVLILLFLFSQIYNIFWYIESQCYTLIALLAQPAPSQNKNDENPVSRREATPCTKRACNKNLYLRKTQKTNDHRHINEYSEKHAVETCRQLRMLPGSNLHEACLVAFVLLPLGKLPRLHASLLPSHCGDSPSQLPADCPCSFGRVATLVGCLR